MKTRFPQATSLLPMLLAAAAFVFLAQIARAETPTTIGAEPQSPTSARPGSARPGFYMALDLGSASYDLDDLVASSFEDLDLDLSESANGGGLMLGWSWNEELALELQLFGGEVSTNRSDVDAALFEADLALRVPLMPRRRVAPYVEGHLGVAGLAFEGDAIDDRVVFGGTTGLGGGVEFHVSRRWSVDLGYRFSLVDFEREAIDTVDGDREFDIEGTGRVHRMVLRTAFSF